VGALYGIVVYLEYRDRVLFKQKCEFWVPNGNVECVPSEGVRYVLVELLSLYQVENVECGYAGYVPCGGVEYVPSGVEYGCQVGVVVLNVSTMWRC